MGSVQLSTEQLLQLSADQLLSEHTVAEAAAVGRQLQREVDKKREELRVMVGERYRDLIEAADTIQNMKESSAAVIKGVAGMENTCHSLQQQSLLGYRHLRPSKTDTPSVNSPYLGVAGSIKLLMVIPERVWEAVESGQLVLAAQLYLLARHVHAALQVDPGGGVTAEKVQMWFPIISRQWASLQNFYTSILNSCREQLQDSNLTAATAVDAVAATLLLRGVSVSTVFKEFLQIRKEAVESSATAGRQEAARVAMSRLLSVVITSVQCVYSLFGEGEGAGQLVDLVSQVTGEASPPTISHVDTAGLGGVARHLPEPVKLFKPRLVQEFSPVSSAVLVGSVAEWVESVRDVASREAGQLLEDVTTIVGVAGVRGAIYEKLRGFSGWEQWTTVSTVVTGASLNLWETFYRDAVRLRLEQLLSTQVSGGVYCLQSSLSAVEKEGRDQETDLGWFMWSEAAADLAGVRWAGARDSGEQGSGLAMKCWGWSPRVQELCLQFNSLLEKLREDIGSYTEGKKDTEGSGAFDPATDGPFDRYSDSDALLSHLSKDLGDQLDKMVVSLQQLVAGDGSDLGLVLLLARLYQALPHLAPNMRSCLDKQGRDQPRRRGKSPGKLAVASFSTEVEERLAKESERLFRIWSDELLTRYSRELEEGLARDALLQLPAWDKVTITETGDDGQNVSSVIHVPACPSNPLTSSLNHLSSSLHQAGPASVPAPILTSITSSILSSTTTAYLRICEQKLTQNSALQLSFDLRYIVTLLMSRDLKDVHGHTVQNVIDSLETNIDPFDLSVFSSHLTARVKRATARSFTGLGTLIPSDRIPIVTSYKAVVPSTGQQEQHNVMPVGGALSGRFQLLPLPRTGTAAPQARARNVEVDKKMTKKKDSAMAQKAAGFFESMSSSNLSSWFGSSN